MTIDINLNYGYGRLSVREPFLIATDTPVVLAFHSDYALKDTLVKFTSDTGKSCSFRMSNLSEIEIPQAFVHAGKLDVEVALVVKEKVVKRWSVEPIVFAEDSTGFVGLPELEQILADLAAVKSYAEAIAEHTKALQDVDKRLADIEDIVKDTLE